jgi:hypothetical protein
MSHEIDFMVELWENRSSTNFLGKIIEFGIAMLLASITKQHWN